MSREKRLKDGMKKAALGFFFVLLEILVGIGAPLILTGVKVAVGGMMGTELPGTETAYAVLGDTEASGQMTDENGNVIVVEEEETVEEETVEERAQGENAANEGGNGGEATEENAQEENNQEENVNSCQSSLGPLGWLVCPTTGLVAQAVDWLYQCIEGFLVLNPVKMEDGTPVYEIWKYCLRLTNIVFVIFFLVVIYSQLTGWGITNYGVKRALPKIIVMAIMVNLSFLICSMAVDASNIVGMGVRQLFQSVEDSVSQSVGMQMNVGIEGIFAALGGAGLAIGATWIAFETGMIWMLIPVAFGALISVVIGLVTIAMRQAVVILLVMISPLAMACMILPNTEQWYQKWKQLLFQMLVFYPMFSLLFGASQLAGFAIISSAKDGFSLLLGVAVQTFPLIFSWSLMRMSGTFLETINSKMHAMMAGPQRGVYAAADQRRQLSKAKHLAGRPTTPSLRLMQFMSNRRIARDEQLSQHQQTIKNRGLAYRAGRNYRRDGMPSRLGQRTYGEMSRNLDYQRQVLRDQNNMNRGLASVMTNALPKGAEMTDKQRKLKGRLDALDNQMINASDYLKAEQTRGEKIEYENAIGFNERMSKMVDAHMDEVNGYEMRRDANGNMVRVPVEGYLKHIGVGQTDLERYKAINTIMDGDVADTQLVAANATQSFDTNAKIIGTKMNKYFDMIGPTRDVDLRLTELTKHKDAVNNIDAIVAGMKVLNQRGDSDILLRQVRNVVDEHELILGTHASQALGNFLMFDVNGADPVLRRFGKYINLETAMMYSAGKRKNPRVTLDEMVTGEYEQVDPETGETVKMKSKMALPDLMRGTSLDDMGRKALDNLESILKHPYTDAEGNLDVEKYLGRRKEVETAMNSAFVAASLKFMAGGDELRAMSAFLTGYDDKGNARWDPGGDLENVPERAEQYFREQTVGFLAGQTPKNLLGLRSDMYEPLMRHLARAYELEPMEHWSEREILEHARRMARLEEIEAGFMENMTEEQRTEQEGNMMDLMKEMAGAEFRAILRGSGKLEQIYRTRKSGAANNAKDWVREWLELDDEAGIRAKLAEMENERARQHREEEAADVAEEEAERLHYSEFTDEDREEFANEIEREYERWVNEDGEDVDRFYEDSRDYVQSNLRDVAGFILDQYERFRRARPRASARDLAEELKDLLRDDSNY